MLFTGSSRNFQGTFISAEGGAYKWDSVLESLPDWVILKRDEQASPLMLCLGRSVTFVCRIRQSKARLPGAGGSRLRGVSRRLLHVRGSNRTTAVVYFANIHIAG